MTSHSFAPRRSNRFPHKGFSILMLSVALLMSALSSAQTLTSISIVQILNKSAAPQLPVMANRQFTAYANYSDGSQQYITQQAQWSTADPTIATVTPTMGLVMATGVGTVNITANAISPICFWARVGLAVGAMPDELTIVSSEVSVPA